MYDNVRKPESDWYEAGYAAPHTDAAGTGCYDSYWSPSQAAAPKKKSHQGLKITMIIIGARAMSVKELTDRLKEKGESPENAEDAAAWLQEMHLLDDAQYAAMCVRHYAAKGYGAGRIRSELYRRGIPRELWDEALQELPEQDAQIDTLLRRRIDFKNDL